LKFEKTVTWPPENRGSVAVWFRLKTAVFGFGFKTVTALMCWRHSIVVRMLVSDGELALSCARLLAGWVTTVWFSRPLTASQHGQLSHPSLRGR